jgi:hypothetical protein
MKIEQTKDKFCALNIFSGKIQQLYRRLEIEQTEDKFCPLDRFSDQKQQSVYMPPK